MNIPMPYPVKYALRKLREGGYRALLVGGCVRDSLLGKTPSDFDVTTSALPDEVLAVFKRDHVITNGLKHGTVTLIKHGVPVEITTFRIDGEYLDNRKPEEVTFTDDLGKDVLRRDFTVNALCWSEEDGLVDYVGGEADLRAGLIRCVGEPDLRFNEDALRMLRALRFSATLDFDVDPPTAESARENAGLISHVAAERIMSELLKMLAGGRAERVINEFREVLVASVPALAALEGDMWTLSARRVALTPPVPELRLAALLADLGENGALEALTTLKSSKRVRAIVSETLGFLSEPLPETRVQMRRALAAHGEMLPAAIELKCAAARALAALVVQKGDCATIGQLAIGGAELKQLGIGAKRIGGTLGALLEMVIEGKLPNEAEALLAAAREMTRVK